MDNQVWETFEKINNGRRAIRYFTNEPVRDDDVKAILAAGQFAPSSGNLQPYELHWVKDKEVCKKIGKACNQQRAASTVSTFIVIVATYKNLTKTYKDFLENIENSAFNDEKAKMYYKKKKAEIGFFSNILSLKVFGLFYEIFTLITPLAVIAPIGQNAMLQWTIKNSIFAAQTILLAASARGIDSCPMEGFNAIQIAKILKLKRGYVIPLVIALGKRNPDKEIEIRWRQSFAKIVKVH
jgi:nitroreductase